MGVSIMKKLTNNEMNDLYEEHKGIIYYMANRYRHLDDDLEELIGWSNLGYAKAMFKYQSDNNIHLVNTVFSEIQDIIRQVYYRGSTKGTSESSLYIMTEDGTELIDFMAEEFFSYSEREIAKMIEQALFEEEVVDRGIAIDSILRDKQVNEIANETKLPKLRVRRSITKGEILLKQYLSNNGLISDYLLYGKARKAKVHDYIRITTEDMAKIKYMKLYHQHLKIYDIAKILNLDYYPISVLFEYPTTNYLRVVPDESIKNKVETYCKIHHPERMASKVTTSFRVVKID